MNHRVLYWISKIKLKIVSMCQFALAVPVIKE